VNFAEQKKCRVDHKKTRNHKPPNLSQLFENQHAFVPPRELAPLRRLLGVVRNVVVVL
jgi:hypothetical protein